MTKRKQPDQPDPYPQPGENAPKYVWPRYMPETDDPPRYVPADNPKWHSGPPPVDVLTDEQAALLTRHPSATQQPGANNRGGRA